jgi:hypothetical protein
MAHQIREIPKIGRIAGNVGGSGRGSVIGDRSSSQPRSSVVTDKISRKRDASELTRKNSAREVIPPVAPAVELEDSDKMSSEEADADAALVELQSKIAQLQQQNADLLGHQLEKETEIRAEVSTEMAQHSACLLDQIRALQDELYSIKNDRTDVHRSVKKARRIQDMRTREGVTKDLLESEEEMEALKLNYEREIKSLKCEVRSLKAEVADWRKKAETSMKLLAERKDSASSSGSLQSQNNENELTNAAAESFDQRMQRDQRFNKHKKLAELSPKFRSAKPHHAAPPRDPLSPVSPNNPLGGEDATQGEVEEGRIAKKMFSVLGQSPPPSPHRSSDALPIAPPPSDMIISGSGPFYPNRILRSQLRAA